MREAVRGALRKAREHLGIEIPILRLVLRAEDAALGGSVKTFLQFLWIHAPKKLFECGARGGESRSILRLELTEVLANRFDGPRAGRQGGQQADQCFVDSPRKIQGRFRTVVDRRRDTKAVAELVAALIEIHQAEDGFAQELACKLQRHPSGLAGDGARLDAGTAAEGIQA